MMMSATSTTGRTGIHTIARPQPDRTNAPEMISARFAREATGREHGADRGLAPLCLCEQEHVHIGAEAAAHIGEEEIEPVQSIQLHARDQSISLHPLHALKGDSKAKEIVAPSAAVPIAAKDARGKRSLIAAGGSSPTRLGPDHVLRNIV